MQKHTHASMKLLVVCETDFRYIPHFNAANCIFCVCIKCIYYVDRFEYCVVFCVYLYLFTD